MAHDASGGERSARREAVATTAAGGRRGHHAPEQNTGWYWLFLLPFFGTFLPWIYNSRDPEIIGLPFFYWYQLLWVLLTVIITIFVYRATRRRA
jgi:apolipoprotein N-acyltransferase